MSEGYNDWVRTQSPYLIIDQSLKSSLRVKAVDGAGNYRIEEVPGIGIFNKDLIFIPISLMIGVLVILLVFYKRAMRKYKKIQG